ncbi:MAG: cupin domain-containing protein [Aggregatilineales bacterium]
MTDQLRYFNSNQMVWQPHPTVLTIMMKVYENNASQVGYDAVLVQVQPGNRIDWHYHAAATETIYIVQGTGQIFGAIDERQQNSTSGLDLAPGVVVTVPVGLRHAVTNIGDESLVIFAFHSAPTL